MSELTSIKKSPHCGENYGLKEMEASRESPSNVEDEKRHIQSAILLEEVSQRVHGEHEGEEND